MSKARIIWSSIGIVLAAALLVLAVIWGYRMRPKDMVCVSMAIIIEDRAERQYVTEGELTGLLQAEGIYPVGRKLDIVSLHRIEKTVVAHPMVRTAECYLTPRNEVRVRLTQRVPLLRVQIPGEAFFIDTDRRVMPARAVVKDSVLLATGAVGVQMASGPLADFAEWLQDDSFWKQRVHHVRVESPQMVYVYQRGNNQPRVAMGNMRGYEQKLAKLRVFIENGAEATQDKNYTELDLRFKGQVIGRY